MIIDKPLPSQWRSKRLKYLATYNDQVLPETTEDDKEIDYVEISGVSLTNGIEEVCRMPFHQAPSRARRKVKPGDILVSTVRTYLKAIAAVTEKCSDDLIASTGFCVIRPTDEIDSGYLGWVAKSEPFVGEVVARSVGVSYPAINASDLVDIGIPVPHKEVQQRIARFLDEKTARIDALIEKKQALLERLAEKRQAFITRAVTKGLNPDAPMKSSGITWLDDIPEHWQIRPIKRHIQKIDQGWSPRTEERKAEPDEWGILKSGCVNLGVYDESEHKTLPAELDARAELQVKAGDVLMCRASGSLQYIGSVALVERTRPKLMFSDKTYRITVEPSATDSGYFVFMMWAKHLRDQILLSVSGAEGLANNIPQSSVQNYVHAFPPLSEQKEIADFVRCTTGKMNAARQKVAESIETLRAYRTALITAAVTGQHPELNG